MSIYPWQQQNWLHLVSRYHRNNLPHALLFHGIAGLGKLSFAMCFAQFLLCKNSMKSNIVLSSANPDLNFPATTCNCLACDLFRAGNHPDYFVLQSEGENKPLKVEQIRELISELSCTAHQGGWQIAIIDRAETMNEAAANALLKTLEEPLGNKTMIILVSAIASRLPATILSRCQTLAFSAPPVATSCEWLNSELLAKNAPRESICDELITVALKLANAAPLAALSLLESDKLALRKKILGEILDFLAAGEGGNVVACGDHLLALDVDLHFLLFLLQTLSADFIKSALHVPLTSITNQDYAPAIQKISASFSLDSVLAYNKELLETKRVLALNIALNKQLLVESLLLNFKRCA